VFLLWLLVNARQVAALLFSLSQYMSVYDFDSLSIIVVVCRLSHFVETLGHVSHVMARLSHFVFLAATLWTGSATLCFSQPLCFLNTHVVVWLSQSLARLSFSILLQAL
jgi:hypothetical protein